MKILNKKTDEIPANAIYIGRGSPLGNPFKIGTDGDRAMVITLYKQWLSSALNDTSQKTEAIRNAFLQLKADSILTCYCSPSPCHGNVINDLWEARKPKRSLFYAGIGARATPGDILKKMTAFANRLDTIGFTVRSGGANGADSAFDVAQKKEIYLPWKGFNNHNSSLYQQSEKATEISRQAHPYWDNLSPAIKKLMTRNVYQILGHDCESPSDFIICWTNDGAESETTNKTGGTGHAIRIANKNNIPVFNLKNENAILRLKEHVQSHPLYIDIRQTEQSADNHRPRC